MRDTNDRLFDRFRDKGDVHALGAVFDRTSPELLRIAMSLVGDPAEADDLLQATFLTAIERARRYDGSRRLVPWLLGILVRHAHELRRTRARTPDAERLERSAARDPYDVVEGLELSDALETALVGLSERYADILRPFLCEGRSAAEIARERGLLPSTVRMRIHRGLERLRRALPRGLALGAFVTAKAGRGLDIVRSEVLSHAAHSAPALAAAGTGAGATAITTSSWLIATRIGGLSMLAKLTLGSCVLALALALPWLGQRWLNARSTALATTEASTVGNALSPRAEPTETGMARADATRLEQRATVAPVAARDDANGAEGAFALVDGRVLESDGEPVVGISVALCELHPALLAPPLSRALSQRPRPPEFIVGRTSTDETGAFRLTNGRANAAHLLGIDLGGPRATWRPLRASLPVGGRLDYGDVILLPTTTVTGRVIGTDGNPLENVRIRLGSGTDGFALAVFRIRPEDAFLQLGSQNVFLPLPAWLTQVEALLPIVTTRSDRDGNYRFEGVAAGSTLVVFDQRGRPTSSREEHFASGTEIDLGTEILAEGERLEGRVVDAFGAAVVDAEVFVGDFVSYASTLDAGTGFLERRKPTDAQGAFIATGLGEDHVVVSARRRGASNWQHTVFAHARQPVTITLEPLARLVVTLRDEQGAPVAGARFYGRAVAPVPILAGFLEHTPFESTELGDGLYALDDISWGEHELLVRAPGHGLVASPVRIGKPHVELDLVAPAELQLAIRLLDPDGAPVAGAWVGAYRGETTCSPDGGRTDAEGRVRLVGVAARDLADGLELRASHPAWAPCELTQAALQSDPTEEIVVRLTRGGSVDGRVLGTWERGPRDIVVRLTSENARFPSIPVYASPSEDGAFALDTLTPGTWTWAVFARPAANSGLMAAFSGWGKTFAEGAFEVAEGETSRLTIDLEPRAEADAADKATLAGSVRIDGVDAVELGIQLHVEREGGLAFNEARSLELGGAFEFASVPAGTASITISRPTAYEGVTKLLYQETFDVEPGAYVQRDFAWERRTLFVTVLASSSGRPVAGASVRAWKRTEQGGAFSEMARTGPDGRAELSLLAAGDWHLSARHDEEGLGSGRVRVPAGAATHAATVELDPGVPFRGELRLPVDVRPGPVNLLVVRPTDGRAATVEQVEFVNGRAPFSIAGLGAGRYFVGLNDAETTFEEFQIELPPEGRTDLVLQLSAVAARELPASAPVALPAKQR